MSGTESPRGACSNLEAPKLDLLQGIDQQKASATENVSRLAQGYAAHDMLLWGSREWAKSALLRSAVLAAQSAYPGRIALVQAGTDALEGLTRLFAELGEIERNFLVLSTISGLPKATALDRAICAAGWKAGSKPGPTTSGLQ